MKRGLLTTLSVALLFTACRKSEIQEPAATATTTDTTSFPATPPPAHPDRGQFSSISNSSMTVTDWEPGTNWTRTNGDNGTLKYTLSRGFHQLTQSMIDNGAVLVFSKGYNFADNGNMPAMGMPFYFYLPIERMNFPVYWDYLKKIGGVDVKLELKEDAAPWFASGSSNVRMRYFVFSPQELQRRGLDTLTVRSLSYQQLVDMYNLVP
ncbi:MAG: hypothetical protein EOO08_06210 [Chitinophagaceae bacterium]|nr:MAG: hypothetical protein EOO08_06210 [Chitinophagaceae bacterium]